MPEKKKKKKMYIVFLVLYGNWHQCSTDVSPSDTVIGITQLNLLKDQYSNSLNLPLCYPISYLKPEISLSGNSPGWKPCFGDCRMEFLCKFDTVLLPIVDINSLDWKSLLFILLLMADRQTTM